MAEDKRARILVSGHVQGVFFRAVCRAEAGSLGLAGWVRNLGDGRVEAVFQGAPEAVDRMLAWCRSGPPMARVEAVEVAWEVPDPSEGSFRAR